MSACRALFGQGEIYILREFGDMMVDAGLLDGNMFEIRKRTEEKAGVQVVALDEKGNNYGGIDS